MPLPLHRSAHPEALRIIQAYPEVFGHPPLDPSQSSLVHGFLSGPGWHPILAELAGRLSQVVREDRLESFVVWHVAERSGVLTVRHSHSNDRISSMVATAATKSQMVCEDCTLPSRRQVRDKWGSTLCDACYLCYLSQVTVDPADQNDRPLRLTVSLAMSQPLSMDALDFPHAQSERLWRCDMCREMRDRGTDFGGSWIDRHCVRSRDGALIGIFTSDGYWKSGNGEVLCGECVDALIGHLIQPPAGMIYDRRRNRSVVAGPLP